MTLPGAFDPGARKETGYGYLRSELRHDTRVPLLQRGHQGRGDQVQALRLPRAARDATARRCLSFLQGEHQAGGCPLQALEIRPAAAHRRGLTGMRRMQGSRGGIPLDVVSSGFRVQRAAAPTRLGEAGAQGASSSCAISAQTMSGTARPWAAIPHAQRSARLGSVARCRRRSLRESLAQSRFLSTWSSEWGKARDWQILTRLESACARASRRAGSPSRRMGSSRACGTRAGVQP